MKIHGAHLFIDGRPIGAPLDVEISTTRTLPESPAPADYLPPDAGRYNCSFSVADQDGSFFRALREGVASSSTIKVAWSIASRYPTRKPYAVTSRKSRAGRLHYGCPKLGQTFWKLCSTALERRKLRSQIDAFNRNHPPAKGPTRVDAFEGEMTEFDVRQPIKGGPWEARLTLRSRTAPAAKRQSYFPTVEGVSGR